MLVALFCPVFGVNRNAHAAYCVEATGSIASPLGTCADPLDEDGVIKVQEEFWETVFGSPVSNAQLTYSIDEIFAGTGEYGGQTSVGALKYNVHVFPSVPAVEDPQAGDKTIDAWLVIAAVTGPTQQPAQVVGIVFSVSQGSALPAHAAHGRTAQQD